MIVERERSELERAAIHEDRDACKLGGVPVEGRPDLPALRGLSVVTGKAIINAVNGFVISRRFTDEFVAKKEVEALREQVLNLMRELEHYRQRVSALLARQQH